MREVVHHFIYISRRRAGLVGVLHGWVGMQTASRHSPAPDPAPGQPSACNTVVPTQGARGGGGGGVGWPERPKTAQSAFSPSTAPWYSATTLANKTRLQASASGVAGSSPPTSATANPVATRAWSWSTGASTRPTWPTNRMSWHAKMRPCAPSWCAGTSASTVACWLATVSSRGSLQTSPTASTGRAAAATRPRRPRTPTRLITATTAAAAAPASTRAAAPLRPTSEQGPGPEGHEPQAMSPQLRLGQGPSCRS